MYLLDISNAPFVYPFPKRTSSLSIPSMKILVSFSIIGSLTTKDTGAWTEWSSLSKFRNPWYTPVWKSSGTINVTSTDAEVWGGTVIVSNSGQIRDHLFFS